MSESRTAGARALRNVLSFTFRQWSSRKALRACIVLAIVLSTQVILPVFAGRLVDALAQGRSAVDAALHA